MNAPNLDFLKPGAKYESSTLTSRDMRPAAFYFAYEIVEEIFKNRNNELVSIDKKYDLNRLQQGLKFYFSKKVFKIVQLILGLSVKEVGIGHGSIRFTIPTNAITFPKDIGLNICKLYWKKKYLPDYPLTFPHENVNYHIFYVAYEILKFKRRLLLEKSEGSYEKIYPRETFTYNQRKIAKGVKALFHFPSFPTCIWVSGIDNEMHLEIPSEVVKKLRADPSALHAANPPAPKLDVTFLRPSAKKPDFNFDREADRKQAVDWYAYKIVKAVLKFTSQNPAESMKGLLTPMQLATEKTVMAESVATQGTAKAVKMLGLEDKWFISTYVSSSRPERVFINLSSEDIRTPLPPYLFEKKESMADRLYQSALANEETDFTLVGKDGEVALHQLILEKKTREALSKLPTQQSPNRVLLDCSLKVLQLILRGLYYQPLEDNSLNFEEAKTLTLLSQMLGLTALQSWGIHQWAPLVDEQNFLSAARLAEEHHLDALTNFLQIKIAGSGDFKDKVEQSRLRKNISSKVL